MSAGLIQTGAWWIVELWCHVMELVLQDLYMFD
jgi:hypothetical protein